MMTDDELIARHNAALQQQKPKASSTEISDEELVRRHNMAVAGREIFKGSSDNKEPQEQGKSKLQQYGASSILGSLKRGAVSGAAATLKGGLDLVSNVVDTASEALGHKETEKDPFRKGYDGFSDYLGDVKRTGNITAKPGEQSQAPDTVGEKVGQMVGSIVGMPGKIITQGAEVGAQFIEKGENGLASIAKVAGGALAGKGLEWLGNAFANRGTVQKGASKLVDELSPADSAVANAKGKFSGPQLVDQVGTTMSKGVESLKAQNKDLYTKTQPLWKDAPSVGGVNGGWTTIKNNQYIQSAVKSLDEMKVGDKRFGDLAEVWKGRNPKEAPTVGQLDALKQYMDKSLYTDVGAKIDGAPGFAKAVDSVRDLAKGSSNTYKATMEASAPLQEAKNVIRQYIKKGEVVNPTNIINLPPKQLETLKSALDKAGVDGSDIVSGYMSKKLNTMKYGAENADLTQVLDALVPNKAVLDNLMTLTNKEDAAAIKALWQAKLAIKNSYNVEKIPFAGPMLQRAKDFIKLGYTSGDAAIVDAIDKGAAFKSKQIRDMLETMLGSSISTSNRTTSNNQQGNK